jgi:hypothetical protein
MAVTARRGYWAKETSRSGMIFMGWERGFSKEMNLKKLQNLSK